MGSPDVYDDFKTKKEKEEEEKNEKRLKDTSRSNTSRYSLMNVNRRQTVRNEINNSKTKKYLSTNSTPLKTRKKTSFIPNADVKIG